MAVIIITDEYLLCNALNRDTSPPFLLTHSPHLLADGLAELHAGGDLGLLAQQAAQRGAQHEGDAAPRVHRLHVCLRGPRVRDQVQHVGQERGKVTLQPLAAQRGHEHDVGLGAGAGDEASR